MTGEVTLRGRVLPIGGLKEKTMAAKRYGIHTVLIPKDNARDLEEIDQTVRAALRFIPVEHGGSGVCRGALPFQSGDRKPTRSLHFCRWKTVKKQPYGSKGRDVCL